MSKEAISRVLNAEAEANAIRERAQTEARDMISTCESTCAKKAADEVSRATADMKARQVMIGERAEALISQSREEAGADIEAIQVTAKEKMREAVKHIEWELCDI